MKNVLFLFTDQQRADTIHALGNPDIVTPALDALAAQSTSFGKCYTPSPVCVPARLSLMTGQYPARTGNNNNNRETVYGGDGFYAEFTRHGYDTCCVGKMHNCGDLYAPMGFGKRVTQEEMADPRDDYHRFLQATPWRNVFDYNGQRTELYYMPQVSQLPAELHPTQWIGDRCVEHIEAKDDDRPLFLFASFIHPHPPFSPPAPWNKMYRGRISRPLDPEDRNSYEDLLRNRYTLDAWGIGARQLETLKNHYYACVSFVDYQVGRIVKALKDKGLYDDTVIAFTSDHGELLGDYRSMGKRTMLDAASRVPFLLRVPGRKGGVRTDVCSLVDLPPTLLSLCGIPYDPAEYDGVDLGASSHDVVYSQYGSGTMGEYMVASDRDKLVYSRMGDRYFYFDSFPDDRNKFDLSNPRVASLKGLLDGHMASDRCPHPDTRIPVAPAGQPPDSFYPPLDDHGSTRERELARMPEGYGITLGSVPSIAPCRPEGKGTGK